MDNNFQREGSISNAHVGRDFENKIQAYFAQQNIELTKNVAVSIGVDGKSKPHNFDLGSIDQKIIVECKSHTWTATENVPSAKLTTWDQAMYFFYATHGEFRKIFVVLKHISTKRNETLCDYYIRIHKHLIPNDVEIWEFSESNNTAIQKI